MLTGYHSTTDKLTIKAIINGTFLPFFFSSQRPQRSTVRKMANFWPLETIRLYRSRVASAVCMMTLFEGVTAFTIGRRR